MSTLPVLKRRKGRIEVVDDSTSICTGGKNGYKNVKKLGEGQFQGYDNQKKLYTASCPTAREAAIALEKKRMALVATPTESGFFW